MKKFKFLCCILVIAFVATACSGNKDTKSDEALPRAVTTKEAQLLSHVLYENNLIKNATFSITSGGTNQGSFRARGKVEWDSNTVALDVSLDSSQEVDIRSITTAETVFETYVNFAEELRAAGMEERTWVKRNFDATTYGIDALALFVIKLATTAPDNPVLIKQNGAQFLGTETVAGQEALKLTTAGSITYYINEEGELLKVVAPVKGFGNDISIVFSDRGNTTIEIPVDSDVYAQSEVASFFAVTRPPF